MLMQTGRERSAHEPKVEGLCALMMCLWQRRCSRTLNKRLIRDKDAPLPCMHQLGDTHSHNHVVVSCGTGQSGFSLSSVIII